MPVLKGGLDMGKICIVPDTHGRTFWKDIRNHVEDFDKIVFLGDYVSPYPNEGISNERAIEVFKEVLDFKKDNPEKVILLLGNHDLSYFNIHICECRTDHKNWNLLNELYAENIKLFDLAWETEINGKRYFFSHAGVRKGWLELAVEGKLFKWDDIDVLPPADMFNNVLHVAYDGDDWNEDVASPLEFCLGRYSDYRGYSAWADGSIVWADIREYEGGPEYEDVMFICGHTQLKDKPIITDWVADLDVRRPFILDTVTGKIEEYV